MNQISSKTTNEDQGQPREGYIQVYTGEGKGKTSAGVGQLIRALGHQLSPYLITFFKGGERFERGNLTMMKRLEVPFKNFVPVHPSFGEMDPETAYSGCEAALRHLSDLFKSEEHYDLILLDEVNVALRDDFLDPGDFLEILEEKPPWMEMILTGRGAPEAVVEVADIVSDIHEVKHVLDQGVPPRAGFEY